MFWFKPETLCQVRGLYGGSGFALGKHPTSVSGFEPLDGHGWGSGDYFQGCHRVDAGCNGDDRFEDLEAVRFGFGNVSLVKGKSRSFCELECLGDCGCIRLSFEKHNGLCKKFYGSLSNFQNLTVDGERKVLHVRVPSRGSGRKRRVERKKLEEDEEDGFLEV
ncbi:uncharacterized protein HKW66_Vig0004350 [Vigna angularis]|uniref:Apple domain-containing protein n=1 Tax=Phaseolus angularis TaxID=3914 RepID=A0A8T0LAE9_PHAAN|nr:uncharacterized protein HKW66_Vig0004350 [Vigna angularis]